MYIFQVYVFCHTALSGNGWRAASARLVRGQDLLVVQCQGPRSAGFARSSAVEGPMAAMMNASFLTFRIDASFLTFGLMRCVFDF